MMDVPDDHCEEASMTTDEIRVRKEEMPATP
jgi:hypothetical protein